MKAKEKISKDRAKGSKSSDFLSEKGLKPAEKIKFRILNPVLSSRPPSLDSKKPNYSRCIRSD